MFTTNFYETDVMSTYECMIEFSTLINSYLSQFSSSILDPEKETFTGTTDSADIESDENDSVFGDTVPEQEIDDTLAICSDLFQQLIEANFPEGRTNGIHNFTDIEIAPVDNESLDDIFIHPIGKLIMQSVVFVLI